MAWVVTDDKHYKAIADKIRTFLYTSDQKPMKPSEMPDRISRAVYDQCSDANASGYTVGFQEGYDDGFTVGEESGLVEGKEIGRTDGLALGHADGDAVISDTNIGDYYNDRITKLPSFAFSYRKSMTSVNLPNVTSLMAQAFSNCTGLIAAELPRLASVTSTANFSGCTALRRVDLGVVTAIPASTFNNDAVLNEIVLRHTSVCALGNVNAFSGTPYASGGTGGKIYVPSALIESYKTATNWSVLYGYGTVEFVALEGSEYA